MRILLRPSKDSSIYEESPNSNYGLDEILEFGKSSISNTSIRALIDFNIDEILQAPENSEYYLNLKIANATKLEYGGLVETYRISGSWAEGSGYYFQERRNSKDGVTWNSGSSTRAWVSGGGDFYNSPSAQNILEFPLSDFRIDVTDILNPVVSSSRAYIEDSQNDLPDWNGLIVKFSDSIEDDAENTGVVKVFSNQTHTVHSPTLEIAWDDSTFVTGSRLKEIPDISNISISAKNTKDEYYKGTKELIQINVRDRYPGKNFDSTPRFKSKYYLPLTSYYSIVDVVANTVIYPYDDYSKISTDTTESFFILDTTYLYENRKYSVNIKIISDDGQQLIIKDMFSFWVK